jgi:hypothetical protein
MTNRKQVQLDRFKEEIDSVWQLSISEEEFLETVFNFLLARDTHKANTLLNSLKNGDWEELLKEIPKNAVINFSESFLDMIEESEVEDCRELKDLEDYDDDDLLDECSRRDLKWENYEKTDITSQSQLEELTDLFLSVDLNKRNEIINSLR